jgi:hypothetical protein
MAERSNKMVAQGRRRAGDIIKAPAFAASLQLR